MMMDEAKKCPWMLPETGTTDDAAIALWDRFVISNFAFHTCCTSWPERDSTLVSGETTCYGLREVDVEIDRVGNGIIG